MQVALPVFLFVRLGLAGPGPITPTHPAVTPQGAATTQGAATPQMADAGWVAVLLGPLLLVMHFGVIAREERYLERKFGDEYLRYKAKVRRWI